MTPDRIVLIGFMGSGKTTVGGILAERLDYQLADTDALIQERAGAPIARIFAERGEQAFRDIEAEVLGELARMSRVVVATGGGAPAQPRNRSFFTRGAATFHLRVSLATARERAGGDLNRPLMAQGDDALGVLYERRTPVYEQLGTGVETEGRTPAAVAEEIIRWLRSPRTDPRPAGTA